MKILILGSNGMAGHVITKYLSGQGYSVTTFARSNASILGDVENQKEVTKLFNKIKNDFDFIINCIGLLVQDSNSNPDKAAIVNAWFPHMVEKSISDSKTKLIHLSTDCVFNGDKGNYVESDIHTETNFYGKSKSYGEVNNHKDITFRMSIIGPEIKSNGTGLMHWFINKSDPIVNGWDNALWNGITTLELAKCIEKYIRSPSITGVYHLVNNDNQISKYELLEKINSIFDLNKTVIKTQGPKPVNKILVDTRNEFDFSIADYNTQLQDLKYFK